MIRNELWKAKFEFTDQQGVSLDYSPTQAQISNHLRLQYWLQLIASAWLSFEKKAAFIHFIIFERVPVRKQVMLVTVQ